MSIESNKLLLPGAHESPATSDNRRTRGWLNMPPDTFGLKSNPNRTFCIFQTGFFLGIAVIFILSGWVDWAEPPSCPVAVPQ